MGHDVLQRLSDAEAMRVGLDVSSTFAAQGLGVWEPLSCLACCRPLQAPAELLASDQSLCRMVHLVHALRVQMRFMPLRMAIERAYGSPS